MFTFDSGPTNTIITAIKFSFFRVFLESRLLLRQRSQAALFGGFFFLNNFFILLFCLSSQATAKPVTLKVSCCWISLFALCFLVQQKKVTQRLKWKGYRIREVFGPMFLSIRCGNEKNVVSYKYFLVNRGQRTWLKILMAVKRLLL